MSKKEFYLVPNKFFHPLIMHLLSKRSFEYIYIPLQGILKYLLILPSLTYPIFRVGINQMYIILNIFFFKIDKILSYSFISPSIQKLRLRYPIFKIFQIQNAALDMFINHKDKNKRDYCTYVDNFLSMSSYQSDKALNRFAKESTVVGLLSTEDWLANVQIACKISGYDFDICYVCPNKLNAWDDYKFSFRLSLLYIFKNKSKKLIIALKKKTKIEELSEFCKCEFNKDLLSHDQIFIKEWSSSLSTIKYALNSKIIVGSFTTALYQLGALGMLIYPIDLSSKYGYMSGNLCNLALNLNPTEQEFLDSVLNLSTTSGREEYFSKNYNALSKLDETLLLPELPSSNIVNFLEKNTI